MRDRSAWNTGAKSRMDWRLRLDFEATTPQGGVVRHRHTTTWCVPAHIALVWCFTAVGCTTWRDHDTPTRIRPFYPAQILYFKHIHIVFNHYLIIHGIGPSFMMCICGDSCELGISLDVRRQGNCPSRRLLSRVLVQAETTLPPDRNANAVL